MNAKWLIPVDGSQPALHAVEHVIAEAAQRKSCPQILLVNVQPSLPSDITRFIERTAVQDFHREAGDAALAPARKALDAATLAYSAHILIGDSATCIVEYAREQACTQIVMGARGLGSVVGLLMGSVMLKVIQQTDFPVVLVK